MSVPIRFLRVVPPFVSKSPSPTLPARGREKTDYCGTLSGAHGLTRCPDTFVVSPTRRSGFSLTDAAEALPIVTLKPDLPKRAAAAACLSVGSSA